MAMSMAEFERRVKRLEETAAKQPGAYKMRVFLLAMLGYAYMYLILAVVLGLLAAIVVMLASGKQVGAAIKLLLFFGAFAYVLVRALWVRIEPPAGRTLRKEEAPELFQTVEELRMTLKTPNVHEILLTDDFNAAMYQYPRLGLLGWHKNYLLVGLPLMTALSPDQFRAIVAHELGHLSGAHSRFGGWIYRVKASWSNVMREMEKKDHWASFIFTKFFAWYVPVFDAYTFVLRRANEYEADRMAAMASSDEVAAAALINVHLRANYLEAEYWPSQFKKADGQLEPPLAFHDMKQALKQPFAPEQGQALLEQALAVETDVDDTHPALQDRLRALGQTPRVPAPVIQSSAEQYLGGKLSEFTTEFDEAWQQRIRPSWQARYEAVQGAQQRLIALDHQALFETLNIHEAYEHAALIEDFRGPEYALPLYRELMERDPSKSMPPFAVGRLLLDQGQEEGIALIEKAIELVPMDKTIPGCERIYHYLMRSGREEEAGIYAERAMVWDQKLRKDKEERSTIGFDHKYLPHGLDADTVRALQAHIARYPAIKQAYLVQKHLIHFPDNPLFVIGLVIKKPLTERSNTYDVDVNQHFIQHLGIDLPAISVVLDKAAKPLKKNFAKVPQARIK